MHYMQLQVCCDTVTIFRRNLSWPPLVFQRMLLWHVIDVLRSLVCQCMKFQMIYTFQATIVQENLICHGMAAKTMGYQVASVFCYGDDFPNEFEPALHDFPNVLFAVACDRCTTEFCMPTHDIQNYFYFPCHYLRKQFDLPWNGCHCLGRLLHARAHSFGTSSL